MKLGYRGSLWRFRVIPLQAGGLSAGALPRQKAVPVSSAGLIILASAIEFARTFRTGFEDDLMKTSEGGELQIDIGDSPTCALGLALKACERRRLLQGSCAVSGFLPPAKRPSVVLVPGLEPGSSTNLVACFRRRLIRPML